jgi:Cu2+-exporting ATPase/Cu+-exporting ATPase
MESFSYMETGFDSNTAGPHWTFFIEGVRCSNCVQKLESLGLEHREIISARFDKGKSLLDLILIAEKVHPEQVIAWIHDKGYKAYFILEKADVKKRQIEENRSWLLRLAVTFFCAANIMMFAIAIYAGAGEKWKSIFSVISGILFLPVFVYSALPFYRSSLLSLKECKFTADVAIAIAFGWGSILSYYNLARGNEAFYFDSSASFLFLILFARYVLYRTQKSIESELNPSLLFKNNPFFDVRRANSELRVQFNQIKNDDIVHVKLGQMVPVDGVLVSLSAEVDTSVFSGESLPQTLYKDAKVKAGMLVQSDSLNIQTVQAFENSELYHLFEGVLQNRQVKTKAHTKAEIYSQRLLTAVSIGSVSLLFWFGLNGDWNEGFLRALALFTIACPCALALAIPLASITALKRAASLGIIAKTPLIFEKLSDINRIVFDKTGTLTEGYLDFAGWGGAIPNKETLSLLLGLEERSQHPLAKSVSKMLRAKGIEPSVIANWVEIAGEGVSGEVYGEAYKIKKLDHVPNQPTLTGFTLFKNEQALCSLYFKDKLRPESAEIIKWLVAKGLDIQILSGDRKPVVEAAALELGLPLGAFHSEMSPQDKNQILKGKNVLMVGDGHNDSLALSSAYASLAISGSAETSLQAADAYSKHVGLLGLPTLFLMSEFYQRLIKQNILLSLTYNLIAGLLAIFGFVNPLMAAVLMPINSLVVISATALARPSSRDQRDKKSMQKEELWKHSIS